MPRNRALLVICAAAVGARVAAALLLGNTVEANPGIYDQISYHRLALRVLAGHGFTFDVRWWPGTAAGEPTAHWSYLYTLALTGLYALIGPAPLAARLLQAVATGVLTPLLTYRVAQRALPASAKHGGLEAAPLLAAAWSAVYGYFIYYSAALVTEAFFIVGVLWVLDCALRIGSPTETTTSAPSDWRGWGRWVELGAALGLTLLLRQVFGVFVPILFGWLGWRWLAQRARLMQLARGGLVAGVTAAVLILPATAYNYARFQRLVLINTNAGFAFYWANHPIHGDQFIPILDNSMPSYQDLIPAELTHLDEAALDQALLRRGLDLVWADPIRYARLSLSRVPAYFMFWVSAESSLVSNIVRVLSFGVALPIMLLGLARWAVDKRRQSPGQWLLVLFITVYALVHLLSWALIRYRLPVDAVGLVFAGQALAPLAARLGRRLGGMNRTGAEPG
jgi:hypothetical protein